MKKYFLLGLIGISMSCYALDNGEKFEECSGYIEQFDYEQAVPCFEGYLKTYVEFDYFYSISKDGLFFAYYGYAGEFLKASKNDPKSALFYYQEAYNIASDSEKRKLANSMITIVKGFLEYQKNNNTSSPVNVEQKIPELKIENTSSDATVLANLNIVVTRGSEAEYKLNNNVLRQEVVGIAANLGKLNMPNNYKCRNLFQDVSASMPNSWICRAVEIAADNGIVSIANKSFRPEGNITRIEALAILLKSAGIGINVSSGTSTYADVTEQWQINVLNTALNYNFIDSSYNFYPNKEATRGEIFNMARRISDSKN